MDDVDTLEQNNGWLSVNVYRNIGPNIKILRATSEVRETHVNLLLVEENDMNHYILINDFSRFTGKMGIHNHVYCYLCHDSFANKAVLSNHSCGSKFLQKIKPSNSNTYRFSKLFMTLKAPYILYYKIHIFTIRSTVPEPHKTGESVPVAYALLLLGLKGVLAFETYHGDNVIETFLARALKLAEDVIHLIDTTNNIKPPTMEEVKRHEESTNFFYRWEAFSVKNNPKQFHHDHTTGTTVLDRI